MDIAGGVRLTYKVDFSKYEQIYAIQSERDLAKRQAISVILKNIDNRISALGVSDYSARQQNIGNETFLVIEIGGVHSIETAKEIIGKTVELEFKVPAKESEKNTLIAERKTMANDLFTQIKADPSNIENIAGSKEGNEVYLTELDNRDFDTLSTLYSDKKDSFLTAKSGDVIQSEGIYIDSTSTGGEPIEGYGLIKINSVQNTQSDSITTDKFTSVATQFGKNFGISTGNTHNGTTGEVYYDETSSELRLNSDMNASSFGGGEGLQVLAMHNISPTEQASIITALKHNLIINGTEVFINKTPQWVVAVNPKTNEILNGAFFSYAAP